MPGITLDEVKTRLRAECAHLGGQSAWGRRHGFSVQYVNGVLHGEKRPSARLLAAMGLERVISWKSIKAE